MESKYENLKYIPLSSNDMLKLNKNTRLITYKDLFYCNFGKFNNVLFITGLFIIFFLRLT